MSYHEEVIDEENKSINKKIKTNDQQSMDVSLNKYTFLLNKYERLFIESLFEHM